MRGMFFYVQFEQFIMVFPVSISSFEIIIKSFAFNA